AKDIENAVAKTLESGYRTGDIYFEDKGTVKVNTTEFGDKIISFI
ncbi:MAG: hypothetical protein JG767_2043, partial [Deferribacteraceae bacterium]|nr:hypothetical protein [Deferribacteraceae bacterium]